MRIKSLPPKAMRYRSPSACATEETNSARDCSKRWVPPYSEGGSFQTRMAPDSPPMAVINEAMARQLWLGVVGDMRRQGVERFDPTTDV